MGDINWLKMMYPAVKKSMDYCIRTWDPREVGAVEEPHHNTYDIEFLGREWDDYQFLCRSITSYLLDG